MNAQIYFIQHGQIPSASQKRLTAADEGLSDVGKQEAQRAAQNLLEQLSQPNHIRIVSSPKRRALETAEIIAKACGMSSQDIQIDNRLRERDCDSFAGQLISEVFAKDEAELVAGGMEPLTSLYDRTERAYQDALTQPADVIVLVGHSGNVAPLVYAAKQATLGDTIFVPTLQRDMALRLK